MRFFSLDVLYAPQLPDLCFWWKSCVLYSRFYGSHEKKLSNKNVFSCLLNTVNEGAEVTLEGRLLDSPSF